MRKSSGILMYRNPGALQVFLVHPGGPFWKGKEAGAWSIPKGEFTDDEEPLAAALREFREETGKELLQDNFLPLTPVKQKAGKLVFAWAVEGTVDATRIQSNTFRMEFPPKSGKWTDVPEVDKAAWFGVAEAMVKLVPGQRPLVEQLIALVADR
jgi:predicted NUDIX family NTP pyrophosphohydrolase